jgi:hypothetical protein
VKSKSTTGTRTGTGTGTGTGTRMAWTLVVVVTVVVTTVSVMVYGSRAPLFHGYQSKRYRYRSDAVSLRDVTAQIRVEQAVRNETYVFRAADIML